MAILWEDIIFGPIHSRRVGTSLGINLLPIKGKVCTFDCIYCECGWNKDGLGNRHIPTYQEVSSAMEQRFSALHDAGVHIDSISFTGNGEPTINPDFAAIVDETVRLRNLYLPDAKISIFSNSTTLGRVEVRDTLHKIDNPILKLDTADSALLKLINRPSGTTTPEKVVEWMKLFGHDFIMQTLFFRGSFDGIEFDNSQEEQVAIWRQAVLEVMPREVMLYSLDRESPAEGLKKVSAERMMQIAEPLAAAGITIQVNQ